LSQHQTAPQEQRRTERVSTSLYAIWEMTQQSVLSGDVTNFSTNGCFVQSRSGLPTKPVVDLQLRLPTERWIMTRGHVVHTNQPDGFGLNFTGLNDEDRMMLGLLVDYYKDEQ
jgi:hypothetical protein